MRQIYLDNSPLYRVDRVATPILMSHGDADVHVSFSQSEIMFNALRRLEKPAVLLKYHGEPHDLSEPRNRDAQARMADFFDHFLKGGPVPDWWRGSRDAP